MIPLKKGLIKIYSYTTKYQYNNKNTLIFKRFMQNEKNYNIYFNCSFNAILMQKIIQQMPIIAKA